MSLAASRSSGLLLPILEVYLWSGPSLVFLETSMLVGQLAIVAAAIFFGAALYVSIAEQPARRDLDSASLLSEWRSAYKRGFAMQAPLALIGFLLALIAAWQSANWRWVLGGLLLVANWPYTLLRVMPINRRLMAPSVVPGPETRRLIDQWATLHLRRTALGFAATALLVWASPR
jgi:hypothetical protein